MSQVWSEDLIPFQGFSFDCSRQFFIGKGWTSRQETKGYKFFIERYIHDVETCGLNIRARCYRSQKKNEKPHHLSII